MHRLSDAGLDQAIALLDADDVVRSALADRLPGSLAADPTQRRIAELWIGRHDGWEAEFAAEQRRRERIDAALAAVEAEEHSAGQTRADAARAERAESELAEAQATNERLRSHAATLAADLKRTKAALAEAEQRSEELAQQRARAVGELKSMERLAAERLDAMRDAERARDHALAQAADARNDADFAAGIANPVDPTAPGPEPSAPRSVRRRPIAPPPGLMDDSDEAAAHFCSQPGAVLLVDGYNQSMWRWPGLGLIEQRRRLVQSLAALHARRRLVIEVVFDGNSLPAMSDPSPRGLTVNFSPAETEADDVIIERVRELGESTPVLVASDDRRVRDAVRADGATLLTAAQLHHVMGTR